MSLSVTATDFVPKTFKYEIYFSHKYNHYAGFIDTSLEITNAINSFYTRNQECANFVKEHLADENNVILVTRMIHYDKDATQKVPPHFNIKCKNITYHCYTTKNLAEITRFTKMEEWNFPF